jgi:predicted HTH domain antitoxin
MVRITGSFPEDLNLLIEGSVEAGVFGGKSDALREFVREYFEANENERIAAAVVLYETGRIALGDAARLANVDRWTMREIIREHGIDLRLGLIDEDEADDEATAAKELEFADEKSDVGESQST